jgi:hypothetical protein
MNLKMVPIPSYELNYVDAAEKWKDMIGSA